MSVYYHDPRDDASPYPEYDNSSVGEKEHFEWRHVKEALSDWQVWALSTINATVTTPSRSALHVALVFSLN